MKKIFSVKKRSGKVIAIAMAVVVCAGTVFYACKKDNLQNDVTAIHKNGSMVVTGIDYSRIQKQDGMLKFESWGHYIDVINALQDFCIDYTQNHIANLIEVHGGVNNEDSINEWLDNEGFSQFVPIHAFCNALNFTSLYQKLEPEELAWQNNAEAPIEENPFVVWEVGCYQSALHNANGYVMVAGKIYKTDDLENPAGSQKAACRNESVASATRSITMGNETGYAHVHCYTNQSFTRAFANPYKYNKKGKRRDWWPPMRIVLSGVKYSDCEGEVPKSIYKDKYQGWSGYIEMWHFQTSLPAHLHPYDRTKLTCTFYIGGMSPIVLYM
jgi:hypothetical protein